MNSRLAAILVLVLVPFAGAGWCGGRTSEQTSTTGVSAPATALDERLKLVLSDETVLRQMHAIVARHGMKVSRIYPSTALHGTVIYTIEFRGGAIPQNVAWFVVHTALEGPPPLTLAVTFVGEVNYHLPQEGPPPKP